MAKMDDVMVGVLLLQILDECLIERIGELVDLTIFFQCLHMGRQLGLFLYVLYERTDVLIVFTGLYW